MKFSISLAAAAFVFSAGMASASPVTFQGSFEVTEFNSSDPGLKVYVSPTTGDFGPVDLMPGEYSGYGYLFSIWTDEKAINADDKDPKDISVELTFSSPITVQGLPSNRAIPARTALSSRKRRSPLKGMNSSKRARIYACEVGRSLSRAARTCS